MAAWGKPETLKLIDLGADDKTQVELEMKRTKGDQFEVVMDGVVQQLVEPQDRAEERYIELKRRGCT